MTVSVGRSGNRTACGGCPALSRESRCEIPNGELCLTPAASTKHQRVRLRLAVLLFREVEMKGLGTVLGGPCSVMLSPRDIVRPDMLVVRRNRTGIIGKRMVVGPPDLAVDIVSDRGGLKGRGTIYASSGIPECWVVDPVAESIEIRTWSELGYVSAVARGGANLPASPLLPGLRLRVSDVFRFRF